MTTLWVDAGRGAAGDMLLAALWDAGADPTTVRAAVRAFSSWASAAASCCAAT